MASSDSQIDKPQRGCPKRAELPDVNINTGTRSINTERASLRVEEIWLQNCATIIQIVISSSVGNNNKQQECILFSQIKSTKFKCMCS